MQAMRSSLYSFSLLGLSKQIGFINIQCINLATVQRKHIEFISTNINFITCFTLSSLGNLYLNYVIQMNVNLGLKFFFFFFSVGLTNKKQLGCIMGNVGSSS